MNVKTIALLLVVALASVGATYSFMHKQISSANAVVEPSEGGVASAPLKIAGLKVAPALAGDSWSVVAATGKVTVPPDRLVKISPRIEGKIVAAYPTVGDYVRRGQVLAIISSVALAEARAGYSKALARLNAAQKNYARELQIVKLGAVSARPFEEARSADLSAQGDLADAKSELAQAKSELTRQESELTQCKARLERARELYADKIVSKQDLETAEAEYKQDGASVDSARSKVGQAASRVQNAMSGLDISKKYLAREERVYKNKAFDARALQSARSDVEAAQVEVRSAADGIRVLGADPSESGDTLAVTSPIAGRVVSRQSNVGEVVAPSDAIFTVADLSKVWIEADVYENDLAKVHRGQSAEIRLDAFPGRVFTGKTDSIGDILNPESRTAKVRCLVSNADGLLRGEMFAKVSLLTAKRGRGVFVAKEAVLDDNGEKIAFTPCMECPEDRKAGTNACGAYDKLNVQIGPTRGNLIEVVSGIEPGTLIVTTGAYQLKAAMSSGKLEAGCTDH